MRRIYVDVKDKDIDIEAFKMALQMSDINVDYATTDLILKVKKVYDKRKGKLTINETVALRHDWEVKWDTYMNNKDEKSSL